MARIIKRNFAPGGLEGMQWPIYDSADVAAATTELSLFKSPIGTSSKTQLDTNMRASGVIVEGEYYDVMSIAVGFRNSGAASIPLADLRKVLHLGYLVLSIHDREVFSALLTMLPSGGGEQASTGALTDLLGVNGVPASNARYFFKYPIRIKNNIPFGIAVKWPVAAGVSATCKLVVWMDGMLYRRKV